MVTKRCSPSALLSSTVRASGSFRTPSPSDSDMPCFLRFAASFSGRTRWTLYQYMHDMHIRQMLLHESLHESLRTPKKYPRHMPHRQSTCSMFEQGNARSSPIAPEFLCIAVSTRSATSRTPAPEQKNPSFDHPARSRTCSGIVRPAVWLSSD
jgi:hypothetical protein